MIRNQKAINLSTSEFLQQTNKFLIFNCAGNLIWPLFVVGFIFTHSLFAYDGRGMEKNEMKKQKWRRLIGKNDGCVFFFLNLLSQLFYQNNNK